MTTQSAWQLPPAVSQLLRAARGQGQNTVLVTGVFDLLHEEHKIFLRKAKAAGDVLVVGVESDARVRSLKGEDRPVNTQGVRLENLEKLRIADGVFILPENFSTPVAHRALITEIHPSILAVSSHTAHLDRKQAIMDAVGGRVVVVHEHNPEVSTTRLLQGT